MSHHLMFVAIATVVIVTPGQDTALTIRNTLVGGRPTGIATALGVSVGQALWSLATSLGIAAILVASAPVFAAVKLAGAAYLVYIGVQALRTAVCPHRCSDRDDRLLPRPIATRIAFRQGLLSNLGNPKMAVFFTSLLPQFAPTGRFAFLGLLALGLIFCAMTCLWLAGYAFAVARAGDWLHRPRVQRGLDGLTGVALVGFGVRLATER